MGLLSALLMNDNVAIIGTPWCCPWRAGQRPSQDIAAGPGLRRDHRQRDEPIGNPQNLLIAIHGNVANPFVTFFKYLMLPTLVNWVSPTCCCGCFTGAFS
jgi:Na+/H+ antiporter NhaD/arsenite permease-like protein